MPKQIYNEGRVVGLSAYEVYVRHHLQEDPGTPPASEKEWLASSIAMGSSMILQIDVDTSRNDNEVYYRDYILPENCRLCAANTIFASFFTGYAEVPGGQHFAVKVQDYGKLISNTSTNHPKNSYTTEDIKTIPVQPDIKWSDEMKNRLAGYVSIIDGLFIQPGKWKNSTSKPPQNDFEPIWSYSTSSGEASARGMIRIQFRGPVKSSFQMLLTGFTSRAVIAGVTGIESGSTASPYPADGDFLGPLVYPWGSKIIFTFPTSAANFFLKSGYSRKIPVKGTEKTVSDSAVIDMKYTDPHTYYIDNDSDSAVEIEVTELSTMDESAAILTVYEKPVSSGSSKLPPALYASRVTNEGTNNYLNPIDTVAPGTLKFFGKQEAESELKAKSVEANIPNNFAFFRRPNDNNVVYQLNSNKEAIPVANTQITAINHNKSNSSNKSATSVDVLTGDKQSRALSMQDANGQLYSLPLSTASNKIISTGSESAGGTTIPSSATLGTGSKNGYIAWGELLEALANGGKVDLFTSQLRTFVHTLPNIVSSGVLKLTGTGASSVGGSFTANGNITSTNDKGVLHSGKNYIEFYTTVTNASGTNEKKTVRFYISGVEPTGNDIPIGSIGIGWGMEV